jgi:hypothetical protein
MIEMAARETDPYDEIISEILSADDISRIRSLWNSDKYPKWYDDVSARRECLSLGSKQSQNGSRNRIGISGLDSLL